MMLRIDEVLKLSFESFDIVPGESKFVFLTFRVHSC